MIAQFARSYVDFWTGPTGQKMAALNDEGVRSLAHFLYSGPNCHPFGLYFKTLEALVQEFKRPTNGHTAGAERQVLKWLQALEELNYAAYDRETGFLWVREMAAHQFAPLPLKSSNLLIKSARRWYATISRNPFLGPFFDRYDKDLHLSDAQAFAGSEVERREWISRVEQPALIPEALAERRKPAPATKNPSREEDFIRWLEHYPAHRRNPKKRALDAWVKRRIGSELVDTMIATLEAQKRTPDWTKESGRFVPLAHNYLKDERDADQVAASAGGSFPCPHVPRCTSRQACDDRYYQEEIGGRN